MEQTNIRANDSANIAPANRGSSKKVATTFTDANQLQMAPSAMNPADNVTGTQKTPAGTPNQDAAALVADAGGVELGTDEWEQLQLAKAITQLRQKYQQMATEAGGNISDPYWRSEYDKAVDLALDDIRSQSADNRQVTEEAQKGRDFESTEAEKQRRFDDELAKDQAKRANQQALMQGIGQGGMNFLTTPVGGKEAKLAWGSMLDDKGNAVLDSAGKPVFGLRPSGEDVKAEAPITKMGKSAWDFLKSGFKGSPSSSGDPFASPLEYKSASNFIAPSLVGTGIGMALPGKKGNALLQGAGGMAAGGLDALVGGGSSPWTRLLSSAGGACANPFNKSSWGKNTTGTISKMVGTAALSGLSRLIGL